MFNFLKTNPHFFFSTAEKGSILEAIQQLESQTSAELRVHVQKIKSSEDILLKAQSVFEKLGMSKTAERNGVLIFICPRSRRFAVIGDSGIHEKLPLGFWDSTAQKMEPFFQRREFSRGVIEGIQNIGIELKRFFPLKPDDRNELPNKISFS